MTRYILVGGGDRSAPDDGQALGEAMRRGVSEPKVLSCFFAEPREVWEDKYPVERDYFTKAFRQEVEVTIAFPDTFEKQVKDTDIVYIHGGDDTLLAHYLDQFKLEELFKGKVVVGSSAGAHYLSAMYWTCDWRRVGEGRGLVKVASISHFESTYGNDDPRGPIDWAAARRELESQTQLPICALHEAEFVVF